MKIDIPFEYGDKVNIIPLNKEGRVISIHINRRGNELTVKHVSGDKIEYNDFFIDELEHIKETTCGFGG